MSSKLLLDVVRIIDYKRPLNVNFGSITQYFSLVCASEGNLCRSFPRNGYLLFKEHFTHDITVARQRVKKQLQPSFVLK